MYLHFVGGVPPLVEVSLTFAIAVELVALKRRFLGLEVIIVRFAFEADLLSRLCQACISSELDARMKQFPATGEPLDNQHHG